MAFLVKEKFGKNIRLTDERWLHIRERHPEVGTHLAKIKAALEDPDAVVGNRYNPAERYYHRHFPSLAHYLVVIVHVEKGFVITAFISRKLKRGRALWKKT